MNLGIEAVKLSTRHKSNEPDMVVSFRDRLIIVRFYSYCLSLDDGGRHHIFSSKNIGEVVNKLSKWIEMAEEEIEELKKELLMVNITTLFRSEGTSKIFTVKDLKKILDSVDEDLKMELCVKDNYIPITSVYIEDDKFLVIENFW